MAVCGNHRKERTHQTGKSNRAADWKPHEQTGPLNFDHDARSTAPQLMSYKTNMQVPMNNQTGSGNQDFSPQLPGQSWRMPSTRMHPIPGEPPKAHGDPGATAKLKHEVKKMQATMEAEAAAKLPVKITAPTRGGVPRDDEKPKEARVRGHKVAPRWKPDKWFRAPNELQAPLQKEEGETWNSMESMKIQGDIKGQDRLMRTVRRPEDVGTPRSEDGKPHPTDTDHEEYYPGRDTVDAVGDQPGNDFQVRPINLPDFYNPPPEHGDSVMRMQRIREVIKQRYAGRPGLIGVFKNCALTKPGFVFARDLQQVLDQMGIKVSPHECDMLVKAVDKDHKGAVTFEEFADLIYGERVSVGGPPHEPQERHVRHVTKTLVDGLIANGQALGKAFCEIDPERRYVVSKDQFRNAVGTACNHISNQAIDFLWAAQFPGQENQNVESRCIDWRSFMSQLAHFAHSHRAPTPCCVQGRKRQYDLLQRTAAITGGYLTDDDLNLNRPDQNADDEVHIIADKLVHRHSGLPHKPREATFLTPHFVEELRTKSMRVERALPQRIPKARMRELLRNRSMVHQDELANLIAQELDKPGQAATLSPQEPLYAASMPSRIGEADVMTLDPRSMEAAMNQAGGVARGDDGQNSGEGGTSAPGCLQVVKADLDAWVSTQHHNRDHEVNVDRMIEGLYRPMHEKKQLEYVNDGLNRQRRGLRPPRERPPHDEQPRYENYWQSRYIMDSVNDAIAQVENSNGGKIKASRVFKRLDFDNDGYITLSDLKSACEKYKVPHATADLHAMFSELDRHDKGSVDIGEFTRNYEVFQGSLLEKMQMPIKAVHHEGGISYAGPIQEKLDARDAALAESKMLGNHPSSEVAGGASPSKDSVKNRARSAPAEGSERGSRVSSGRSQMSRAGQSIAGSVEGIPTIYAPEVARMTGEARISDVIRSRFSAWKPQKHELHTSMPRTRFGMTCYPDTRHVTEASVPLSGSYLHDNERFKTTNSVHSIFAAPDHRDPQRADDMKKHARNEFRIERIRQRQRDFADRCHAANEAAREFDEMKIARKALNQLNYERRVNMACC